MIFLPLSVYFTLQLKFSYDYEDFFPKGDPDLDFYYTFRDQFEHDDNFLLVGLKPKEGILNTKFLTSVDSATNKIQRSDYAERVYSIANFIKSPFGFIDYPALHIYEPEKYAVDSGRIQLDERISGKLISDNFTTTVIFIKTDDTLSQQESVLFIDDVKQSLQESGISDYHLLGKSNFQVELVKLQRKEFFLYSMLSVLLVAVVTYLLFRKIWAVLISMTTVAISLIIFTGILGFSQIEQNVMSTLFPIVIIIIGISDAIHFLGKYIIELRKNNKREIALFKTLSDIGFATLLTAVTSAIGFLTMLTSNVPPIRFFGVLSALGVLLVYIVVLFLISPLLKLFTLKQLDKFGYAGENKWGGIVEIIYNSGKNHTRKMLTISAVILLIFTYGMTQITTRQGCRKMQKLRRIFIFLKKILMDFGLSKLLQLHKIIM